MRAIDKQEELLERKRVIHLDISIKGRVSFIDRLGYNLLNKEKVNLFELWW